jgi:6,7-dimethyl-8-ribityllumazine synthase
MNTLVRWASETDANISRNEKYHHYNANHSNEGTIIMKNLKKVNNTMEETIINLGIVVAEFNYDVTYAMLELAKEHANFLGTRVERIIKVPGVFDIPLALKKLMENPEIHAVVALGAVVEGQTEHDDIIAQHASRKIVDLSVEYEKPVGLGISGPGMSRLEAHERVEYAKRAVEAAVKMVKRLRGGGSEKGEGFRFGGTTGGGSSEEAEERAFAGLREMG